MTDVEKKLLGPDCGCDEAPECTHALYWYLGHKARETEDILIRADERHACWSDFVIVLKNAVLDCPEPLGKQTLVIMLESILAQGWNELGTGDGKPIYLSRDGEQIATKV